MADRGAWVEYGEATEFRPASQRFCSDKLLSYTIAVTPVLVETDPNWRNLPGSLQWQTSAELFNRNVGWEVACWHWSVVYSGGRVAAGDVDALEDAQLAAEAAVRSHLGRKQSRISAIFPES